MAATSIHTLLQQVYSMFFLWFYSPKKNYCSCVLQVLAVKSKGTIGPRQHEILKRLFVTTIRQLIKHPCLPLVTGWFASAYVFSVSTCFFQMIHMVFYQGLFSNWLFNHPHYIFTNRLSWQIQVLEYLRMFAFALKFKSAPVYIFKLALFPQTCSNGCFILLGLACLKEWKS
jgi:hypothetical protein